MSTAFLPALPLPSASPHPRPALSPCPRARPPLPRAAPPRRPRLPRLRASASTPSNAAVVLERISDTFLDARIHYTRLFTRRRPVGTGARVVVLGSGWAAHSLVKIIDLKLVDSVTVISPRNFFFFTPLLSATAVGTIEFRSIVEPIRASNPYVEYFEAFATDVDFQEKTVTCIEGQRDGVPASRTTPFQVPYDVLVVAVGETTTTFNVSGAREHAFFLKEIADARRLRVAILGALEKAALPMWTAEERKDILHFVVCGGGPTGCEFAGELSDFVGADLAPRYGNELVSQIQVTLLQSGKSLLTQFEASLQSMALDNFAGRVQVLFGARVSEVTDTEVVLQSGDRIAYGVLIWAAGNGTRRIVGKIVHKLTGEPAEDAVNKRRKIPVDEWLRVPGTDGVFALGDCSQLEAGALPSTAQVAGQQGAYLGRLISKADARKLAGPGAPELRDSGGKTVNPFRFLSLGIMAYLGNERAVVQVPATSETNIKVGGRFAYALWASVYAVKQVDVRNRVLVLFDYFKSRVFGRDISQF